MLLNFFKIAYRNILRHKGYAFINITGLAVGVTCCVLIALYVMDELSYDKYHRNLHQLYRVVHSYRTGDNVAELPPPAPSEYQVWGNAPVGPALAADFPEVLKVAQFSGRQSLLFEHGDVRFQENDVFFADSTVFDLFSWKLIQGNPEKALAAVNSVVLTESTAKKYFGDKDPIGQILIVDSGGSFAVTGVMEDVPLNSHFRFNALLSMNTFRKYRPEVFDAWGYVDFYTYFMVPTDFDRMAFQSKVPEFLKRHNGTDPAYTLAIEPVKDAYLHSKAVRQPGTTGSLSNLYIFSTIAIFILLIACINFMNLSTARSMDRAKEVGVRKAVGANKGGLVRQFLAESIIFSIVATAVALCLAGLVLPLFQQLSGKEISIHAFLSTPFLMTVLAGSVGVGLLAGSYPALVLSQFKPALVLKGIFRTSAQGVNLRKGLVVFQFSLSVALIAGSLIVFSQLKHLRTQNLGFQKDQMVVLDFGWDGKVQEQITSIKAQLANVPGVIGISAQRTVPGGFFPKAYTEVQTPEGKMQGYDPDLYEIDYDFISNFGIKMVAGRPYSTDFPTDSSKAMVINEAAARLYGYLNPEDAIGKKFSQWGKEGLIVGVVKDFNYQSLHHTIQPLTLRLSPQYSTNSICLKIQADNIPATIDAVGKTWKVVAPHRPFLYSFMDQSFDQQYNEDARFGQVFTVFAGLAIFIACVGLFGLTTYTVEQRTKEIGIRKVLGASVSSIVTLLSKDFIILVLVAIVIAAPLSWYFMNQWLSEFAYHVTPGIMVFVAPGVVVVVLSLLVVASQAIRTAVSNPTKSLRSE